jgi:hypothetical protein
MRELAFDPAAIAADAVALAELNGGTGRESVHVDDVFDEATVRGVTQRDGWLCGPGIGDNAIAVATAVAVAERATAVLELTPGAARD